MYIEIMNKLSIYMYIYSTCTVSVHWDGTFSAPK